jgi:hypothetical protein
MNLTYRGKIGRLGTALREEVNRRLVNGETACRMAIWLNSLPEVQAVLAADFGGRPISEMNLSKWRKHGYKKWLWRQEAQAMAAESGRLQAPGAPPLTDQMAGWVGVHYLMAVRKLTEMEREGKPDLRVLRGFCRDVVALRRGELGEARLKLERERRELRAQSGISATEPKPNVGLAIGLANTDEHR